MEVKNRSLLHVFSLGAFCLFFHACDRPASPQEKPQIESPVEVESEISLRPGDYGELQLGYDEKSKTITGWYENYTGFDEATGEPRFACTFYFSGKVKGRTAQVRSFSPLNPDGTQIAGELKIKDESTVTLHLEEDHGGCWNVQHFKDEPVEFVSTEARSLQGIRFAAVPKAHFHDAKSDATKRKAYVLKGDILKVIRYEGAWAFCEYSHQSVTKGWIKIADLNTI